MKRALSVIDQAQDDESGHRAAQKQRTDCSSDFQDGLDHLLCRLPSLASDKVLAELQHEEESPSGVAREAFGSSTTDTDSVGSTHPADNMLDKELNSDDLQLSGPEFDELSDDLLVQPDDLDDFEDDADNDRGLPIELGSPDSFLHFLTNADDAPTWAHLGQDSQHSIMFPAASGALSFGSMSDLMPMQIPGSSPQQHSALHGPSLSADLSNFVAQLDNQQRLTNRNSFQTQHASQIMGGEHLHFEDGETKLWQPGFPMYVNTQRVSTMLLPSVNTVGGANHQPSSNNDLLYTSTPPHSHLPRTLANSSPGRASPARARVGTRRHMKTNDQAVLADGGDTDTGNGSNSTGGKQAKTAGNVAVQCIAPGCQRRRQLAADGSFQYCRHHMIEAGGTPARPMCEVQGCERYARLSSEPGAARRFCVKHMVAAGLQPLSSGPSCEHPRCSKLAQQSTNGNKQYCPLHMTLYGLQPEGVICAHTGCCRLATYSLSGECTYCVWHMREHGLQPMARFVACEEPGCRRQSTLSSSGVRRYCRAHMGQHGLHPMVDTPCLIEGCTRQAMRGADAAGAAAGLCRLHARAAGVQLRGQVTCAEEGCGKVAQYSTCGVRMYCDSHMRAHGQQPRPTRVCSHPGCAASARLAADGEGVFCKEHMAAAGLLPASTRNNKKTCAHPACNKYAKRGDDGQMMYCKAHQGYGANSSVPSTPNVTPATTPAPISNQAIAVLSNNCLASPQSACGDADVATACGAQAINASNATSKSMLENASAIGVANGLTNVSTTLAAKLAVPNSPTAVSVAGSAVNITPAQPSRLARTTKAAVAAEPVQQCQEVGCTTTGMQATDGVSWFCKEHLAARSMKAAPSIQRRCHKEGCTKWAKRSTTGVSLYCKAHMKEEGLQPTSSIKRCAHPECTHAAKPDTTGKWLYCKGHMQQYGMWPRDYKSQPGQPIRRGQSARNVNASAVAAVPTTVTGLDHVDVSKLRKTPSPALGHAAAVPMVNVTAPPAVSPVIMAVDHLQGPQSGHTVAGPCGLPNANHLPNLGFPWDNVGVISHSGMPIAPPAVMPTLPVQQQRPARTSRAASQQRQGNTGSAPQPGAAAGLPEAPVGFHNELNWQQSLQLAIPTVPSLLMSNEFTSMQPSYTWNTVFTAATIETRNVG